MRSFEGRFDLNMNLDLQPALLCCKKRRQRPPLNYGGSDFFNSTLMSDVSAATSGAMLQAAIASNMNMIARVNALTLAAR
jgi:hypothetical protein